jgi:hypothetical protein
MHLPNVFHGVRDSVGSGDASPDINQQVASTLNAISSHALVDQFPIFGGFRGIDFSQFIVRGHYPESDRLTRYFLTMMWCGRTDLRLVNFAPNKEDDIRQLGTAIGDALPARSDRPVPELVRH